MFSLILDTNLPKVFTAKLFYNLMHSYAQYENLILKNFVGILIKIRIIIYNGLSLAVVTVSSPLVHVIFPSCM